MIIRVISLKGGIGKSTISAFLAKYLSEEGNSKVLLIDKDNLNFSSFLINILGAKVDINKEK
ncbi:MAG: ParA family protein, partial [Sulfolobaceae archaeon]